MTGIEVTRVLHGNDDLMVVNAARVSYAKRHEAFDPASDRRLLRFLARESHWSPYAHPHLLLRRFMPAHEFARYMAYAGAGHRVGILGGAHEIEFVEAGSLWFYLRNLGWMPPEVRDILRARFPESWQAVAAETGLALARSDADGHVLADLSSAEPAAELASLEPVMGRDEAGRLATVTFHLKVPIFVARQLEKHRVDLAMNGEIEEGEPAQNEVSRRYVDDAPELYWPDRWRKSAPDRKQGSLDEAVDLTPWLARAEIHPPMPGALGNVALRTYRKLLLMDVAPEQARMVLPQAMLTEFYWTGSVDAFRRVCHLRLKNDAQEETRRAAAPIAAALDALAPSAKARPTTPAPAASPGEPA